MFDLLTDVEDKKEVQSSVAVPDNLPNGNEKDESNIKDEVMEDDYSKTNSIISKVNKPGYRNEYRANIYIYPNAFFM